MKKIILSFSLMIAGTMLTSAGTGIQENTDRLSDEEKIYGLSTVWKEADKNFVFFDQVPDLDWNKTYQTFIPKVLKTQTTYEYYRILQEFCSLLNDGHTRVVIPWELREVFEVAPPILTELVDGKVIIGRILNDTLERQGLSVGMEIVAIDGTEVHEYAIKHIQPFVFYSTKQDMEVQVYEHNLLKGHIDKPLKIRTKDNKEFSVSRRLKKLDKPVQIFEFKVLDDNMGYLKINRFWGDRFKSEFDSLYHEIRKTSKLIIDISENEGGNSGYSNYVISHLIEKPVLSSRWKTLMYMPAYASWGWNTQWQDNSGSMIQPVRESLRFTKPIVVLISEKTYSAAEDFASLFLNAKRGVLIGRTTAGTTGNPIGFELPGKGWLQICSKRDYLANGKEFVGYGIEPDHTVKKTKDKEELTKEGIKILKNQ